jgi:hypothetical protein
MVLARRAPSISELIDYIKTTGGGRRDVGTPSKNVFGQSILHWVAEEDVLHLSIKTYHLAWCTSGPDYVVDGHDE